MAAMSSGLRVGLVGAGMVARHHMTAWQTCKGAHLAAIADPDLDRARSRASQAGGLPAFGSLAEMASAIHLDAVDIVAPVGWHEALIRQAIDLDCNVLCQKPLVPTAATGQALLDDLPASPRVMVHENWRWRAPYRSLKASKPKGIESFEMRVESSGLLKDASGNYPALQRQPFFAELKRFLVFEVLIHHLDTLAFLFGPLTIHSADLSRQCGIIRGEDHARIDLSAGGVRGTLVGNFCVEGAPPLPRDTLHVRGQEEALIKGWSLTMADTPTQHWPADAGYQDSYTATIQHFADALSSGEPFATPAQTGVELLKQVEQIYRLADRNQ